MTVSFINIIVLALCAQAVWPTHNADWISPKKRLFCHQQISDNFFISEIWPTNKKSAFFPKRIAHLSTIFANIFKGTSESLIAQFVSKIYIFGFFCLKNVKFHRFDTSGTPVALFVPEISRPGFLRYGRGGGGAAAVVGNGGSSSWISK